MTHEGICPVKATQQQQHDPYALLHSLSTVISGSCGDINVSLSIPSQPSIGIDEAAAFLHDAYLSNTSISHLERGS